MTNASLITPWYRQLWPWLLMIMPATAMFGGIFTWWLAATTNNSLVVDDYYREGRAINQQLARDDVASHLGLDATLSRKPSGGGVAVELRSRDTSFGYPEVLRLRLVHTTEAALDGELKLVHSGNGRYDAAGALPGSGHWIVHLEDPQGRWRLVARAGQFDTALALRADPVAAGGSR